MTEKNLEENISETILEKEKEEQPPNKEDATSSPSSSAPKEKEEKEAEASLSQSADKAITLPPRKNSTASEPINNNKQFEEWEREDPMEGVLFNLQRNDTRLTSFDGRYFASLIPESEEAENEKEGEEDNENERKKNKERRDELLNRLFSSLESNTNLKRLSLMGAKLEDRHAEALSRSLRQNTGLVLLDLSFNRIGEKGARHLLECLSSSSSPNRHLRQLFLWGNRPLSTSSNEAKDEEQEKELMIRPETEQEIMRCLRRNREMALHRNDSSEHHHHFSSLEDATEKEEGKGSWILRSLENPQHQPEEDLSTTTEVEEPVKEKEKEKAWTKKSVSYIAKMGTSGGTGLLAKLREASGSNKEHQHGDDAATDDSDSSTNHRRKRSFTTDESKSSPPTVLPPLTLSTSANNASSKESNNNIPVTPPPTPKSGATPTRPVSSHSLFEGLSAGSNIRTRNSTSTAISPRGSSSSPGNNNNNVPLKKKERKERYEKEMEKGQEKILKLKQKYRESERSQLELRQFNEQLSERIEELQQYIEDMQEGKGLWLPSSALSAKAASPYPSVHQFPSLPSVVHPPQQRSNNIEQQRLSAPSSPLIQRSASSTRSASFNSSPLKPPSSSSAMLPRSSLSADEIRGNAEEGENENETTMTLDNLSSEEVALPPSRKRRSLVGGSSSSSPSSSSSSSAKDIKRRTSASSLIQQFEQMSSPDSSDEDGAPSNHSKRKHAHTVSTTSSVPSPSKGSTRVGTLRKTASKASFQKGWGALKKGFKGENKHNEEAGNVVAAAEKSSASTSASLGVAAGKKASSKAKNEKNKSHSKKENKSPQDKNASSAQPTVSAPTTIVHHSSSGPSSPSLASSSPTAEGKGVGLNASSSIASSPLFASFFGGQQQHKSSMPVNPQQPRFVGTVVIGRKLSESELTCKAIEHEEKQKEDEEERETEEDEDKSISAKVIEYDCLVEGWNCVMRELRDVLLFTGKRADKVGALRFAVWKLEVLPYHSNLVRYFLHREYENSFYLYSQRHGIPLSEYLRQKKQSEDAGFSMEELLRYCTNLVEALHYLHSMDYVLKALRPEHVYVTLNQKNEIALLSVDPMEGFIDDLRTSSSYIISAYTAPELLKETDKAPTPEMNVWCLGMLLYELLTLDIPWENESQESIKEKLLAGESPSLPNELKPLPEVVPQHIALTEDASSSSSTTSSSEEKPEEQEEKEKQNEGEQEEKQEGEEQPKKKEEPVEEQAPVVMVGRKEKTERKRVEKLVDLFHNMTALDPTKRPSLDKVQLYLNLCGAL